MSRSIRKDAVMARKRNQKGVFAIGALRRCPENRLDLIVRRSTSQTRSG